MSRTEGTVVSGMETTAHRSIAQGRYRRDATVLLLVALAIVVGQLVLISAEPVSEKMRAAAEFVAP